MNAYKRFNSLESIKKHNVTMQPVIEEKKPQVSHHSAVKMKEVIVGDVKAIRTCKGYILERRKLIVSCVFFFFQFFQDIVNQTSDR